MKNIKKAISKAANKGAAVARNTATQKNLNMVKNVVMSNPKLLQAIARRAGVGDIVDSVIPSLKAAKLSGDGIDSFDSGYSAPGSNLPLFSAPVTSLSKGGLHLRESDTTSFIVSDGSGFQIFAFQINPTNAALFPKAAQIASKFNRWRLNRVRLTFQPTVGTGMSTSSSLGTVCIASTDDPNDVSPENMIQVANLPSKTQSVIYNKCALDFRCSSALLYTGGNDSSTSVSDLRFSSCGVYYAAIDYSPSAFPVGSKMGMLICDYDIQLSQFLLSVDTPYSVQPTGSFVKYVIDPVNTLLRGYHNLEYYQVSTLTTATITMQFSLVPGFYIMQEWVDQDGAVPSTTSILTVSYGATDLDIPSVVANVEAPPGGADIFDPMATTTFSTGRRVTRTFSVSTPTTFNWTMSADATRTLELVSMAIFPITLVPGLSLTVVNADQLVDFPIIPLGSG